MAQKWQREPTESDYVNTHVCIGNVQRNGTDYNKDIDLSAHTHTPLTQFET